MHDPMKRWLYHITPAPFVSTAAPLAPPSLATEGYVHCSYAPLVRESAALYFAGVDVVVLQVDPTRLSAEIREEATPRGPMPHVFGAVEAPAIVRVWTLAEFSAAPDQR